MRLLAALATGSFAYLAVGHMTGNAPRLQRSRRRRIDESHRRVWLQQAGVQLTPRQFWAGSLFVGFTAFALAWALSGAWVVALVPAISVALLPRTYYSRLRAKRLTEVVQAWPDGLRDLAASITAGRALPQAIESLAVGGPRPLREAFARFGTLHQMFGVEAALMIIKEELADPTSDRVIEVLLVAYERGGPSVTAILNDLSDAVTEDLRTLEEIQTAELEQKINARAVFALPWLVLFLITLRAGEFREFYQSSLGIATVLLGALLSLVGLWIVTRLGREPAETRVFASPPDREIGTAR